MYDVTSNSLLIEVCCMRAFVVVIDAVLGPTHSLTHFERSVAPPNKKSHIRVSDFESASHLPYTHPLYQICSDNTRIMTSTREDRVSKALDQLLERLVPQYPDEDESLADQRWDEANEIARSHIDGAPEGAVAEDVNHAADLIKRRLLRGGSPEKVHGFEGLYSRLLSQPVLGQKWGILYFLLRVTEGRRDGGAVNGHAQVEDGVG